MKKFRIFLIAFCALVTGLQLQAGSNRHKANDRSDIGGKVTVNGVLIDTKCYGKMNANLTNDHKTPKGLMPGCGAACATMGVPVGVLVSGKEGGQVYVLVTPSKLLAGHMAKKVRVSGTVPFAGSLIPDKLEVRGANGWQEVQLNTMM